MLRSGAVFVLKHLGHDGIYYVLPGGRVKGGEDPELACLRGTAEVIRKSGNELDRQIGSHDHYSEHFQFSIIRKVGNHAWRGTEYHYFLLTAPGNARMLDPKWQPDFDPKQHKMGIWIPYEWVPIDRLSKIRFYPEEGIDVCRQAMSEL